MDDKVGVGSLDVGDLIDVDQCSAVHCLFRG